MTTCSAAGADSWLGHGWDMVAEPRNDLSGSGWVAIQRLQREPHPGVQACVTPGRQSVLITTRAGRQQLQKALPNVLIKTD